MPHDIQSLTAQGRTLTQQSQILLLVALGLKGDTHQIDGVDLNRTDRQSRTADGVDERAADVILGLPQVLIGAQGERIGDEAVALLGDGCFRGDGDDEEGSEE